MRLVAHVLVAAALATTSACSARDNSGAEPPQGQSPTGGPIGAQVEFAPECREGEGVIACSQLLSTASVTVENLSVARGKPVQVTIEQGRPVYRSTLRYLGPEAGSKDALSDLLLGDGWREEPASGEGQVFVGERRYTDHRITAVHRGPDADPSRVLVDVTLVGPPLS